MRLVLGAGGFGLDGGTGRAASRPVRRGNGDWNPGVSSLGLLVGWHTPCVTA